MALEPHEMKSIIDHVSALFHEHVDKADNKKHPINLGIDDAVRQVTKELMVEILGSDEKAKSALKRMIQQAIDSCIYSEQEHREAAKEK